MTYPSSRRVSVSLSISYVRVCEWAKSPTEYDRPTIKEIEQARTHAITLGDDFILEAIERLEEGNRITDSTPTPKLPGPTRNSLNVPRIPALKPLGKVETVPFDYASVPNARFLFSDNKNADDTEVDVFEGGRPACLDME